MLAYVFPGQGSQFPGMGAALAGDYAIARETFDTADAALDFGLSALCFDGAATELSRTENAQPAILATSVAAYRVLVQQTGCAPLVVAGHSLGEITAHVCAGSLDFGAALRLVRRRGELMQAAVAPGEGAMVAVMGLSAAEVDEICVAAAQSEIVAVANYNGAGQLVVSGQGGAVARARQLATEAGALTRELDVSAPFHCALMAPAAASLRAELVRTTFDSPRIPVVDGTSGRWDGGAADPVELLSAQVCAPVRWDAVMDGLAAHGVRYVIEVGPGARLTSMLRRAHRGIHTARFGEPADLEAVAGLLEDLPHLRHELGYWRHGPDGDLIASDASEIVWAATGVTEAVTDDGWTTRPDGSRMHRYGAMGVIDADGTLRRFDPAAWSPRADGAYVRADGTALVHPGGGDHALVPEEWTVDATGTMRRSDGSQVIFADGDEWSFTG
ncbi:ACP S-malonyltransferase [Nocardia vermiculata]|uniref:[acyl-carrier-protein] S-malonyltransferase n=1 Tax=Nocardia vermiculata TaxID=257274 RepID=A0A846XP05_9NOCA|nr:ACP S-malonyltransferase [Nocardia vermiculata]NKY48753.1 ACP S-malonyltransferase [Nocardia vermiculata]